MINEIYVKVEGLNLSRIAQKMIENGLFVSNLKIKKTYMLFSINEKNKQKLDEILKREHKSYYIVKNTKIKRFFAKLPYFIGSFLPFLMLFAFFYKVYGTILSVKVVAEEGKEINISKVNELLRNNNISKGANKYELSTQDIEKLILKNSTDIAGCTAVYEGRNLIVTIFPAEEKQENLPTELLSKYNGVITNIEAFLGDSKLKVGDLVKEGDILISGSGGASGKVEGKVYFSATRIYNEKQDKAVETGNVFETEVIKLANLVALGSPKTCDYLNYKLEKVTENIIKNLFIPVVKESYIYKELTIVEEIVPFSEAEENIKVELKSEVLNKLPSGTEPINITYSVVQEGSLVRVDCFAEVIVSLI